MKPGFWEILLIVLLVLILFGHSKIPDLMKNLANGLNTFKKELKNSEEKKPATATKKSGDKKPVSSSVKKGVKKTPVKKPVKKSK